MKDNHVTFHLSLKTDWQGNFFYFQNGRKEIRRVSMIFCKPISNLLGMLTLTSLKLKQFVNLVIVIRDPYIRK